MCCGRSASLSQAGNARPIPSPSRRSSDAKKLSPASIWRSVSLIGIILLALVPAFRAAASQTDLEKQIDRKNQEIEQLEREIAAYQNELVRIGKESTSLQNEIKTIDTTRRKLSTDLSLTTKKISTVTLALESLGLEIKDKQASIVSNREATIEILRLLNDSERQGFLETFLSQESLGDAIAAYQRVAGLGSALNRHVRTLEEVTAALKKKKTAVEQNRIELAALKNQLADQQAITESIQGKKTKLLEETKSQESTYKLLVAQRLEKKREVENEIAAIEATLKVTIAPGTLPKAGTKALAWPVASPMITQYFGNTAFALANAAVYNGKGHNGIDLRAPVGTPILAAGAGTVLGVGDTDPTCPNASYGKWVLIRHPNNLATLYAHLSLLKAKEGETVDQGETIGYAGQTGYATGPHLHFAVFAAAGVKIGSLQSKVPGCGIYRLPIGAYNSYLNPLSYL